MGTWHWRRGTPESPRRSPHARRTPSRSIAFAEASNIGVINTTITQTLTPTGIPVFGANPVHIAVLNIDDIVGMAASSGELDAPAGWTLLGPYDSDVTIGWRYPRSWI